MVFNLLGDAYVLIINTKAKYKSIGKYDFIYASRKIIAN